MTSYIEVDNSEDYNRIATKMLEFGINGDLLEESFENTKKILAFSGSSFSMFDTSLFKHWKKTSFGDFIRYKENFNGEFEKSVVERDINLCVAIIRDFRNSKNFDDLIIDNCTSGYYDFWINALGFSEYCLNIVRDAWVNVEIKDDKYFAEYEDIVRLFGYTNNQMYNMLRI